MELLIFVALLGALVGVDRAPAPAGVFAAFYIVDSPANLTDRLEVALLAAWTEQLTNWAIPREDCTYGVPRSPHEATC